MQLKANLKKIDFSWLYFWAFYSILNRSSIFVSSANRLKSSVHQKEKKNGLFGCILFIVIYKIRLKFLLVQVTRQLVLNLVFPSYFYKNNTTKTPNCK